MELWKNIEGYDGLYQISNKGNIRSLRDKNGNNRIINRKMRISKNGYYYTNLWKNSKSKTVKPHRLVAIYFIDNPDNLPCVNHINGNKLDNDVNNLEWCSFSDNTKHAIRCLNYKPGKNLIKYNESGLNKIKQYKKVAQYDLKGNFIKEWDSIKEAQETLNINHISDCINGRRNKAGGYKWQQLK